MTAETTPAPDSTASAAKAPSHDARPVDGVGHGYTPRKDEYAERLRRIEGQVRGIARMVDEDVYCIDILTQVSAASRALQSVALALLEEHMAHCLLDAAQAGELQQEAKLKEASDAIARLVRS